jgi:hypothetical protein
MLLGVPSLRLLDVDREPVAQAVLEANRKARPHPVGGMGGLAASGPPLCQDKHFAPLTRARPAPAPTTPSPPAAGRLPI